MTNPYPSEATRRRFERVAAQIRSLLPAEWRVEVEALAPEQGILRVSRSGVFGLLDVTFRERIEPRDVSRLPEPTGPAMIVTDWISPRTRELLEVKGYGYADVTNNVRVELADPPLFVRTNGADRDPNPKPSKGPSLRGPKAWALLRTLVEVAPPYGVQDLAAALRVDAGYVSRVLQVLEAELLIERSPRGPVRAVDWLGVLRRLTSNYSVLDSNRTTTWAASGGPTQLLRDIARREPGTPWAVTGSFAASKIAPVAAPELAIIYTTDQERLVDVAGLLPTSFGANVVLATPYDRIVFERIHTVEEVPFVSVAQTAADTLTGPARMPAEGDALIEWMQRDPSRWQASVLGEVVESTP